MTAFLLLAFTCQVFQRVGIVTGYYMDTASYARNCENKARPQMQCHGRCQMMKKLRLQEKNDQQNPERRSENKQDVTLSSRSFFPSVSPRIHLRNAFAAPVAIGREQRMPRSVFHPPGV